MPEKYLIFINNNLEDKLRLFYKEIKESSFFKTESITYEDCKSDYITKILKELNPSNLILVVYSEFFKSIEEDLKKYLYTFYNVWFTNIIQICFGNETIFDQRILEGEKYCFPYSENFDLSLQANHFILYTLNLFDKALVMDRLNDYICNSFREVVYSELLAKKNKGIKKLNDELERKNQIDHLTSLLNKNGLYNLLGNEYQRTLRDRWRLDNSSITAATGKENSAPVPYPHLPKGSLTEHFGTFTLMMIDIDNFEEINDRYGFIKGDEILLTLAELFQIKGMFRKNDLAGRIRSSRFFILLPETSAQNALLPAQRLANTMKTKMFKDGSNTQFSVALSIGIAQFHPADKAYDEIIQRATEALQAARTQEADHIAIYGKPD